MFSLTTPSTFLFFVFPSTARIGIVSSSRLNWNYGFVAAGGFPNFAPFLFEFDWPRVETTEMNMRAGAMRHACGRSAWLGRVVPFPNQRAYRDGEHRVRRVLTGIALLLLLQDTDWEAGSYRAKEWAADYRDFTCGGPILEH